MPTVSLNQSLSRSFSNDYGYEVAYHNQVFEEQTIGLPQATESFSVPCDSSYRSFDNPSLCDAQASFVTSPNENAFLASQMNKIQIIDQKNDQPHQVDHQTSLYSYQDNCHPYASIPRQYPSDFDDASSNCTSSIHNCGNINNSKMLSFLRRHSYCSRPQKTLTCNRDRINSAGIYDSYGCTDLYSSQTISSDEIPVYSYNQPLVRAYNSLCRHTA